MRPITIDFELRFGRFAHPDPTVDDNYSLSVMSTEAYVRDVRFKAHGAAVKWAPDRPAIWYDEPILRDQLQKVDWSQVMAIAWHAQFDGMILSHHYGVRPRMWVCPMSMARLLHPPHQSCSLDNIRKLYNLPAKSTPYNLFRDKTWEEMTPEVRNQVARGAEDEVESIWLLFKKFMSGDY